MCLNNILLKSSLVILESKLKCCFIHLSFAYSSVSLIADVSMSQDALDSGCDLFTLGSALNRYWIRQTRRQTDPIRIYFLLSGQGKRGQGWGEGNNYSFIGCILRPMDSYWIDRHAS